MKKTTKKLWSFLLAFAIMITSMAIPGASQSASAATGSFTLYYYCADEGTLYMDIWEHTGLEFAASAVTDTSWGWDHPQGVLQPVEGTVHWHSIEIDILDASADEGFDIYYQSSEDKLGTCDVWSNPDMYTVLVSSASDVYAIRQGTIYTDLAEAGVYDDVEEEQVQQEAEGETVPVESDLYVDKIDGISDDFIRGVDISTIYAEYQSGVKYYDFEGTELVFSRETGEKTFFDFLKECGVNWVRIRIWNDPYDAEGNGYGGGNNDQETAEKIGMAATEAGLQVLIDYHYSDFWSDPSKYDAPKEWKNMTLSEKEVALYDFTRESLQSLLEAGVDVGMVQIGNETNNGMAGETEMDDVCVLMSAGSKAVRELAEEFDREILVAVHYTDVQDTGKYETIASNLNKNNVDYDVFATSYYPFWHHRTEKLTSVMKSIARNYGKKVMVAETSYAYTLEDGDGHENAVAEGVDGVGFDYPVSVQGQTNAMADVMHAVVDMGSDGLGVFYWEPAWIPVNVYDADADDADEVLAANQEAWERDGSGWASSYAGEYEADDAGNNYGGSAWDNQAMFDFYGNPLESINVWKYVYTGTTATAKYETVLDTSVTVVAGDGWQLPDTVTAVYTDNSERQVPVTWDKEQAENILASGIGTYNILGTVTTDEGVAEEFTFTMDVVGENLIVNPGFEDADMSAWNITVVSGGDDCVKRDDDSNVRTGTYALKYWSADEVDFTAEQTLTLSAGVYEFGGYTQGAVLDNGEDAVYRIYANVNGETYSADTEITVWQQWGHPVVEFVVPEDGTEVTVGFLTQAKVTDTGAGPWGTWDDFSLTKTGSADTTKIKPAKVKNVEVTGKKKKVTVEWNKTKNAKKYKVQVSKKKNFKNKKSVMVKGKKNTKATVKKLKSKTKYYVRVRAISADGTKGAWSKTVKTKTK